MVNRDHHRIVDRVGTNKKRYKFIEIDESKLDIFDLYREEIPQWQPEIKLEPYASLPKIYLDIETTGLDPKTNEIIMVGLKNERGRTVIYGRDEFSEREILQRVFQRIIAKNPRILVVFNGIEFDIPFLIHRALMNNITHPFYKGKKLTTFRTAQRFGKPTQYYPYYLNSNSDSAIIDLYHQVLAWDFTARKLTRYTLKSVPIEMGLRSEERLELSYPEMIAIWNDFKSGKGDLSKFKEYLEYDLEDTQLLADFLIPSIYYQKESLPDWGLQTLSVAGNATKWDSCLIRDYEKIHGKAAKNFEDQTVSFADGFQIKADEPLRFQGGLTLGKAGLFFNVCKIDVASLYPGVMLNYGIYPRKDVERKFLSRLKYYRSMRLINKNLFKETGEIEYDQLQGYQKIFINSGYGLFGTSGICFNDYVAAAYVTAYGRAIARHMISIIESLGGQIISFDTDGLVYSAASKDDCYSMYKQLCERMPEGFEIEFEWFARAFYNPPSNKKDADVNDGLRKNYLIFDYDLGKGKIYPLKAVGQFRKRDRCRLEKELKPILIRLILDEGISAAKEYANNLIKEIENETLDIQWIVVTRKAKVTEKALFENGCVNDDGVAQYYKGYGSKQLKTKTKDIVVPVPVGSRYHREFYKQMVWDAVSEIEFYFQKSTVTPN